MDRRVVLAVVAAVLLAPILLGPLAARAATTAPASRPVRMITLTVVESSTQKPLANVPVTFRTDGDDKSHKLTTDDQGRASIPLTSAAPAYLNITAKPAGHVPTSIAFRNEPANHSAQPIPDSVTLPCETGTRIGGVIQDPDGKPIEGATVYLLVPADSAGKVRPAIWDFPVKTDATGHWSCDVVPADLPDVWIRLKHPDYATDPMYGTTPRPTIEKLRDGTGVMVMRRGITVAGTVTGPDGNPVAGATVRQGRDRYGTNFPSTKTDADGHYTFKNVPAGDLVLTVQAKGLSPELKSITVAQGQPPVDFALAPGHALKARVVDQSGKPLAGVSMNADTWRGFRTLAFATKTDARGEFTWDAAPAETVEFNVSKEGYAYIMRQPLTAASTAADEAQLATVTMRQPLSAHVTVTDANTGKPVTRFTVLQGIWWGSDNQGISWERREAVAADHPGGVVDVPFDMIRPGHAVRIEADGYAPAESRVLKDDDGQVAVDFKLKSAANLSAVVLTPDGKPAAGAEVGLAVPPFGIQVINGHIAEQSDHPVTRTAADGRFSFPPQSGKYKIVVAHDAGFATASGDSLAADKPIRLQPWAHVQGTVLIGPRPASGEVVTGWYGGGEGYKPDEPSVVPMINATADATGHFSIDRVAPGELHLGRQIKLSDRMTGYSHAVRLDLSPGQAQSLTIGGTGRPVVGHVLIPPDLLARGNLTPSRASLDSDVPMPKLKPADELKAMPADQRAKWINEFNAAQRKALADRRSYPLALKPDGSFRIEDVPAGAYKLAVTLSDLPAGNRCGWGDDLASGGADVTVPDMPGGRSDEPLELPTLTLTAIKHLSPGDLAPDFAVKTVDGKDLKLADFKGKYVLLDFWATWCGPCVAEIPNVRAAYQAFKDKPNFAVISLSLDQKPETAADFAAKNQMTWPQGFLGDWSTAALPTTYGVRGIPATFLLGADGKIIAKDLRGDALKTEIAKALSSK